MRLIDADEIPFRKEFGDMSDNSKKFVFKADVDKLPTIDSASLRPKGEWISASFWKKRRGHHVQLVFKKCSLCNFRAKARWNDNFCPNCGADMRGVKDG